MAGLVAANRCAELGLHTVLLEKGPGPDGDSNARISSGLFHLAWHPLDAPAGQLMAAMIAATDGEIEPETARAVASHAGRVLRWLIAEGVTFAPSSDSPAYRWHVTPHGVNVARRIDGDRGTYRMVRRLYENLRGRGAAVYHDAAATALQQCEGGWRVSAGATMTGPPGGSVGARSVVLCDGGFQACPELLARHVGPRAGEIVLRAAATGTGDALRMALGAGAAATGLSRFYGHILSRDADHTDLWPYPVFDQLCQQGVMVDRGGRALPGPYPDGIRLANILAATAEPRGWSAVVTGQTWQRSGGEYDGLQSRGAIVCETAGAQQLAACLQLPAAALTRAIESGLGPAAAAGDLVGVPVTPGITFTMGGIAVSASGAVRTAGGPEIAGLFACGSACGGIQGGPRGGYLGGLAVAAITGWLTATALALERPR